MKGFVDEISRSRIAGWCIRDERSPTLPVIQVLVNGQEHTHIAADRPRPDVDAHLNIGGGKACGFQADLDPPLSVFRSYEVEVRMEGTIGPLPEGRRTLPSPPRRGSLRPIVVNSSGRSGSTMLMQEFSAHRRIVTAPLPPYEIKMVAYYASAFRALIADEDRVRSTEPTTMFVDADRFRIGHNPWNRPAFHAIARRGGLTELFESVIPRRLAETFRHNVTDYYDILKDDQNKAGAFFFAEKGELYDDARDGLRLFFDDVREIVLLRDPRDLLCSAIQFWKLPADEALQMLATTLPYLERIHEEARPDTLFIHYEKLILDPARTRQDIYRFLDIEPERAAGDAVMLARHNTSDDARASIGRWRKDLSPQHAGACAELMAPFMRRFGYAVDRTSPAQASG